MKVDYRDIVKDLLKTHRFLATTDTEDIYGYDTDKGVYTLKGKAYIKSFVQKKYDIVATNHLVNEVIGAVTRSSYTDRTEFDKDHCIANLKNGLLNLDTLEFKPHTPDYPSIVQLPIAYDAEATCPMIDKYLLEVTRQEDTALLYEYFAFVLCADNRWRKAYLLVGKTGAGKTTYMNLIIAFTGEANCSFVTLQDLGDDRFASARLFSKIANVSDDLPSKPTKYSGHLKMLTGESMVEAQEKNKPRFSFRNKAKCIFTCNEVPAAEDADLAYYDRWIIIEFPNQFKRGENRDDSLLNKLATPSELSGLLNKAIKARQHLLSNGGFSYYLTPEENRQRYQLYMRSDSVAQFVTDRVRKEPTAVAVKSQLFEEYCGYCLVAGIPRKEDNAFHRRLQELLKPLEQSYINVNGNRQYVYIGITLVP